ncbi:MAG: hypothetical protein H7Y18_01080 [Clostridiaceae bacterium]|nr:hypothetical protein [Clostridiaceae bacterium]
MDKEILEILKRLETKIDGIEAKIDGIETQQQEDHVILRALEHKAEVNKSEHDNMASNINHIMGDVEALRKDISTVEIVTSSNYADIARLKAVK